VCEEKNKVTLSIICSLPHPPFPLLCQVDGKEYSMVVNNGPNGLHGGTVGFDKVVWESRTYVTPSAAGVTFTYTSKDGEEGFPGTLSATADYRLTDTNEVRMEFSATTDKPTPVNLCNHAYWNLCGDLRSNVHDHVVQLFMPFYTPVDATSIPTGEITAVSGTPFDFTAPTRIGDRIMSIDGGGAPGYDHNFVRSKDLPPGGFTHGLFPIAKVTEPTSGRTMVVESNAPGVQFYTGNWLGAANKADPHRAFCLETQNFPDAVNKAGIFPDPILRPGQTYSHVTVHRFSW
jgi:aldose 1-epimerase